jgi:uncharacterized protein
MLFRKIFIITCFLSAFLIGQSQTKNFIDQPYIEVTGNADTMVTPNEIYIKIVISEADTKDKVSVEDLEIKMVNALKALGIETEKDLTTSDMASNFKYYFLRGKDVLKTKEYILKVTDGVTATKVLMQLEDLNISNTSIDRVDHSDMENIKNLMRTKAVENAMSRAVALTKPLNQTIGPAIYIADNNTYNPNMGGMDEQIVVGYAARRKTEVELPKIDFEKIKITMNINVKFILK